MKNLNNNIKKVIKNIPKYYYKKILNRIDKKIILKNKPEKYKNYKD